MVLRLHYYAILSARFLLGQAKNALKSSNVNTLHAGVICAALCVILDYDTFSMLNYTLC